MAGREAPSFPLSFSKLHYLEIMAVWRHRLMTDANQNLDEEGKTDIRLYTCLTELYASPKYEQLSEHKKKRFLSKVTALLSETVGLTSRWSKLFLFLVGLFTMLFFISIPFSLPVSLGLLTVLLCCILLLELSVICIIVRDQMRSGYYKLLGTTGADIEKREEKIQIVSAFPTDSLKRVLKHLKYEISSRKSYLHFILGGSTNLGVFPAVFAIYVAYTRLLNDNTSPDSIVLIFAAIVLGLYVIGVQFSAEVRRLEAMIHCLDSAIDRVEASKAKREAD